jgi:quinol monooxygenase YgiN
MSIPTDDDRELLTVVATITAKPDKVEDVRDLLLSIIEPTRKEDGNVAYTLHQGHDDPTVFVFYEVWTGTDKLAAHLGSPALTTGLKALGELCTAPPAIHTLDRIG